MKLIASGVTFSAAIVRSPSFSRSSSSTTMTIRPARIASIASSMRANGSAALARVLWRFRASCSYGHFSGRASTSARQLRGARRRTCRPCRIRGSRGRRLRSAAQIRVLPACTARSARRTGRSPRPATVRLMPSTAIDPLCTRYGASGGGKLTVSQWNSASGSRLLDAADRVDVALHEVSAEAAVGAQRPLEVHRRARRQRRRAW